MNFRQHPDSMRFPVITLCRRAFHYRQVFGAELQRLNRRNAA